MKSKKIGVSLSGGGVRGIAHLGVLKAFQEHNIQIHHIAATSAGALFAALFAYGYSPETIFELFVNTPIHRYLRPSLQLKGGLLKSKAVTTELAKHIKNDDFSALSIPLSITATDLTTGTSIYFDQGPLLSRVAASCSIPLLYEPILEGDKVLVDGGVLDNLPIKPLIDAECDFKIAVHVNPYPALTPTTSIKKTLEKTLLLVIRITSEKNKSQFDWYLEPDELKKYTVFDIKNAKAIFDIGYNYANNFFRSI